MRRMVAIAALLGSIACSSEGIDFGEQESLGQSSQNLNGSFSDNGFLTRRDPGLGSDEASRREDTENYYTSLATRIEPLGGGAVSIRPGLDTLQKFKTRYGFPSNLVYTEKVAYYYNKGDLGLGREMHCIQTSFGAGEIACYVTNYAAGDDFGEFTFGLSSDVAFTNMNANPPKALATVAMVYRRGASSGDKMLFMAYNANEELVDNAPLDRHGITFAKEFAANGGVNPTDTERFGIPGVNFNNHIPSNCLNCHGGQYSPGTHSVGATSVFLPWDLDQFEYEQRSGRTRDEQQAQFRALNELARTVAESVQGQTSLLATQINGWYNNSGLTSLAGNFRSDYVPSGWAGDPSVYFNVVRASCRGCHLALPGAFAFDSSAIFLAFANEQSERSVAKDLANHVMPHALQAQRQFWQSPQPWLLEDFLRANSKTTEANTLRDAGPGNIVTLDPHLISSALL